jgi:hypothetical protein
MGSNNVFPGSKNNAFQGSVNNVRGRTIEVTTVEYGIGFSTGNNGSGASYGLPATATPPTDGVVYTDMLQGPTITPPGSGGYATLYPVPSDNIGYDSNTPQVVWISGYWAEDTALKYWIYYGQYTYTPPSTLAWSQGPTFLIISRTAYCPPKNLYQMFIRVTAGTSWPNAACIQCYISLYGDGTHLFPIGPAYTPPFYNDYSLPVPSDLVTSFRFNPMAILGASNFYVALKIIGGPFSLTTGTCGISIMPMHI